ncbi:MAG: thioredoxin domain-containing protein [Anaerolineae bacterium]
MPNRLARETSPYLLQHQDNPVDWYPWGEEAFERARREDKLIFLSVGYSACHWCHVMAHESFEDEETAAIMNAHYVNIKVDREERPDVDAIYMSAVQALTGGGGWPMSVWLLPDGRPIFGGTYFPRERRQGMPAFREVLTHIARLYRERRAELEQDAEKITHAISRRLTLGEGQGDVLSAEAVDRAFQTAYQGIARSYDAVRGGFGPRPKFPPAMTLDLLLRLHRRYGWQEALQMVTHTLDRMAWGGMYDQIGGGFHRYSVDEYWLVPHFEKMLYDNALLIRPYLHAYQVTGEARYRAVVEQIIAYVAREMADPRGGFCSSQDADSEGEEGRFFIWTEEELRAALAEMDSAAAGRVLDYWGVTHGPNFEGHSILWVPEPPDQVAARHGVNRDDLAAEVEQARRLLFKRREGRIRPGRDDKVLTAWNGLMIGSLAEAGRALGRPDYVNMAARAADFILREMWVDGRLRRSYKDGRARFNAYLEDYAALCEGLIELYQAAFDLRWFHAALDLTGAMVSLFWDDGAGFYDTSHDHEELIYRPQDVTDGATPAGASSAVAVLLRMAILADKPEWERLAGRVLVRYLDGIQAYPRALSHLAAQYDFATAGPHEIALVGDPQSAALQALLDEVNQPYRPNQVVALLRPGDDDAAELIPLLAGRTMVDGKAAAYVCRRYVCRLPVTTAGDLRGMLSSPA